MNNLDDYFQGGSPPGSIQWEAAGDVDLSEKQIQLMEQTLYNRDKRKVGRTPLYKRWETGPIGFDLADSIPPLTRAKIREALNVWQQKTCIRFTEGFGPTCST